MRFRVTPMRVRALWYQPVHKPYDHRAHASFPTRKPSSILSSIFGSRPTARNFGSSASVAIVICDPISHMPIECTRQSMAISPYDQPCHPLALLTFILSRVTLLFFGHFYFSVKCHTFIFHFYFSVTCFENIHSNNKVNQTQNTQRKLEKKIRNIF